MTTCPQCGCEFDERGELARVARDSDDFFNSSEASGADDFDAASILEAAALYVAAGKGAGRTAEWYAADYMRRL